MYINWLKCLFFGTQSSVQGEGHIVQQLDPKKCILIFRYSPILKLTLEKNEHLSAFIKFLTIVCFLSVQYMVSLPYANGAPVASPTWQYGID